MYNYTRNVKKARIKIGLLIFYLGRGIFACAAAVLEQQFRAQQLMGMDYVLYESKSQGTVAFQQTW